MLERLIEDLRLTPSWLKDVLVYLSAAVVGVLAACVLVWAFP